MSRESVIRWAEQQANRSPRPGYCTGRNRFGQSCYDCSGFTYMAYSSDGKIIPADSSLVARWGRDNGQVRAVSQSRLADLLVHDKYGDPYNSTGPRGHIGLFQSFAAGGRVLSWESAGSGKGVGLYSRPASFWAISVQHPAFVTDTPDVPKPPVPEEDEKMYFLVKGDKRDETFLTDGFVVKRRTFTADEEEALKKSGVLKSQNKVLWPQAYVDRIPTIEVGP